MCTLNNGFPTRTLSGLYIGSSSKGRRVPGLCTVQFTWFVGTFRKERTACISSVNYFTTGGFGGD